MRCAWCENEATEHLTGIGSMPTCKTLACLAATTETLRSLKTNRDRLFNERRPFAPDDVYIVVDELEKTAAGCLDLDGPRTLEGWGSL